jgi:hypothetical protein
MESRSQMEHARALFEGILGLRELFSRACGWQLDYSQLAARASIKRLDINIGSSVTHDVPGVVFDCTGLLFDGLELDCGHHGGLANGVIHVRYHGTKDLEGILRSDGVLNESVNNCAGKRGWYHTESLSMAYGYSACVGGFRPILKLGCGCFNSCGGQRTWAYTRHDCRRYAIVDIILLPDIRARAAEHRPKKRKRVSPTDRNHNARG